MDNNYAELTNFAPSGYFTFDAPGLPNGGNFAVPDGTSFQYQYNEEHPPEQERERRPSYMADMLDITETSDCFYFPPNSLFQCYPV